MSTKNIFDIDDSVQDVNPDYMPSPRNSFKPLETGLYKMSIEQAYFEESSKGAKGLKLELKRVGEPGPIVRHSLWLTTRKSTGCKQYYIDKSDKSKKLLPDMQTFKQLHYVVTQKPVKDVQIDEKLVKIRNWKTNSDEMVKREVPTELVGAKLVVGLVHVKENKTRLNEDSGEYEPINELREYNEPRKFLAADGAMTMAEMKTKSGKAEWANTWREDFPADYVEDTYKENPNQVVNMGDDTSSEDAIPWSNDTDTTPKTDTAATPKDESPLFN